MTRRMILSLVIGLVSAGGVSAVPVQDGSRVGFRQPDAAERAWIASRIYRAVELNFGHWDDVPTYDLPVEYRRYLASAMTAPDRRTFSLATQAFVAGLGNSHTYYSDRALYEDAGSSHGYDVRYLAGSWVVTSSRRPGLNQGDVIVSVNGEPIETFYSRNREYLNASTERFARRRLFYWNQRHLWPEQYVLGLSDGREVRIDGPADTCQRGDGV